MTETVSSEIRGTITLFYRPEPEIYPVFLYLLKLINRVRQPT